MEKTCSRCKSSLPLGSFCKNKRTKDGLCGLCRKCHSITVGASKKKRAAEGRNQPPSEKKCSGCKLVIPLDGWDRNRASTDGLQHRCKECHGKLNAARFEKRRAEDPAWYANLIAVGKVRQLHNRLKKYGLTIKEYERLLPGGCQICGLTGNRWGTSGCVLDHDHDTGKFRGLLCLNCNTGIGFFRNHPELLSKAIEYLNRSRVQT